MTHVKLALLGTLLFCAQTFAGNHPAPVAKSQKQLLKCIRSVVQDAQEVGETSDASQVLDEAAIRFLSVLANLDQVGGGIESNSEILAEKLSLCRQSRKAGIGYRHISDEENSGLTEGGFSGALRGYLGSVPNTSISRAMIESVEQMTDRRALSCKGVILTGAAAIGLGVTVGTGGHVCTFSDGRSSFVLGLHAGWMVGIGATASVIFGTQPENTNPFVVTFENTTMPVALVVGTEIFSFGGTDGVLVGAIIGRKEMYGAEVTLIPLGTNWRKFVARNYGEI